MNILRIGVGLVAWFLGILIPVLHHCLLHFAIGHGPTSNIITRSQSLFEHLPWVDWVYLLAMAVVGAILIVSGITTKSAKSKD